MVRGSLHSLGTLLANDQLNGGYGFAGQQTPNDGVGAFNPQQFLIWSILSRVRTVTLVEVVAVTNSGGDIPAGFVDVKPLVQMVDGNKNTFSHATIFHCPYFRMQAGGNAVILDPQEGDIRLACFADRDISSVVRTQLEAPPGSSRLFDMADALYIGGVLGTENPTQFVRFSASGIEVSSPVQIKLDAPDIEINASATLNMTAPAVRLHATTSYKRDVGGYGIAWSFDGTTTWNIDSYVTPVGPQVVNAVTHNIDVPEIP